MPKFFIGTHEHTMDSKGRVSLPSKFRTEFGTENLVAVPGLDGQINVYASADFKEWLDTVIAAGATNQGRDYDLSKELAYFTNTAAAVEVDSAGRINVPAQLRKIGDLSKDILIMGNMDHVCLWNPERYDEYMGSFAPKSVYCEPDRSAKGEGRGDANGTDAS